MKKQYLIIAILFSIIVVIFSCDKENINDNQKNGNGNSTKCAFDSICFDTSLYGPINEKDLLGFWSFQAFVTLDSCKMEFPNNFSNVKLMFAKEGYLAGNTWYPLEGNYSVYDNKISISLNSIEDIDFDTLSNRFVNAVMQANSAFIKDTNLIVFFNNSKEAIVFKRTQSTTTSEVVDCNNISCWYENICLATGFYDTASEEEITGKWELEAFVNLASCNIDKIDFIAKYDYQLEIEFKKDNWICGQAANSIYGKYILLNNKIEWEIWAGSYVGDFSGIEDKFFATSNNTDYIFRTDSTLLIFYNQSTKVMIFKRKASVE